MLLGIDVGGTFTDAVIIDKKRVVASAKHRTTKPQLMDGISSVLEEVLQHVGPSDIARVTLSTTVVTNTIVEHKEEPVDLYIVSGPGMNVDHAFPVSPICLQGYTDHRGSVVEKIGKDEIVQAIESAKANSQHRLAAISVKFGVRNPEEEQRIAKIVNRHYDIVSQGSMLSGALNFPRRTISAYFNSAVNPIFAEFKSSVQQALAFHHIEAPVYILKADGGSLPMETIEAIPVETVFTGPAASVLGLEALSTVGGAPTVALDIGGTTTDISLWKNGKPLMTKEGVSIRNYPSAVRSFAVTSIGIGGESVIRYSDTGQITVGPERVGPSVALGGMEPTLGDALIVLGHADYGDVALAHTSIASIDSSVDAKTMAHRILNVALETIRDGIDQVVAMENKKTIYVVEDIIGGDQFVPEQLVVIGGTANSLGPSIGEYLNLPAAIPNDAAVANAIGAAVAKHTMAITAHVETKYKLMVIPELGKTIRGTDLHSSQDVLREAYLYLGEAAVERQLVDSYDTVPMEMISIEEFPVIEGWQSIDKIITVKVQLEGGVVTHVES